MTRRAAALAPAAFAATMALAAGAWAAGTPLDAAGFAARTEGWTIHYGLFGQHFGSERYFTDGVVEWRDRDGECLRGRWESRDGEICFAYEDAPGDWRCWVVWDEGDGLRAGLVGEPESEALKETAREHAPLDCPGPGTGV